ncbi:MAG: LacI family DNA-binding transcriptional regulator, partial [Clostridia bacterium]|nr:LacI family DNA-binding transcriptional regulator [Clostridia bacterium]
MKVSIQTIADLAGVSTATVSRVFRGDSYVKEETRRLIEAIAEENGYKPRGYHKRETARSDDMLIGLAVADITNPFFSTIIRHTTEFFEQHDIECVMCDLNENPSREIRCLSMLKQKSISGIIISPTSESAEYNAAYLKELHGSGLPVILLDRDIKGIGLSGVFQNNQDGAYVAVDTLIREGHRKIAFIAGPLTSKPGLDRMMGYMDGLKAHRLEVNQEYILYGDFRQESGYRLTKQLLADHPEVTAIFPSNNMMACGALKAIYETGLRIPEDIGFISYGKPEFSPDMHNGGISYLKEPMEQMAVESAQLMLELLNRGKKTRLQSPKRVSFDTIPVLKGSEKMLR